MKSASEFPNELNADNVSVGVFVDVDVTMELLRAVLG